MKKILCSGLLALLFFSARAQEYPPYEWAAVENPAQAGWDTARLRHLHQYVLDSTYITGMLVIQHEKVVFRYGNVEENSYIASCRKSVLSMLYGAHVQSGEIDLTKTIGGLGIDDKGGLLPVEKQATVKDIISARSGVFHPASYFGDYLDLAPKRGTAKPGAYWLYSNWDFNMAGYIFEQATHRNIYDEVERVLAVPLRMQDWDRSLQNKEGDTSRSKYLAYPMYFSTRDMARIGQLMLNNGKWAGKQIISTAWTKEMLTPRTNYDELNSHIPDFRQTNYRFGYGYMWWLWQDPADKRMAGGYSAIGNMGQSITVFPAIDVVVVYKTKSDYERETPFLARYRVLELAAVAFAKSR